MYSSLLKYIYRLVNHLKLILRDIIPSEIILALRPLLSGQAIRTRTREVNIKEWQDARNSSPWHPGSQELREGVNLVGYFSAVKGISQAARSNALALSSVRVPYTVNDYRFDIPARQLVDVLPNSEHGAGFQFNTNLLHINPPQLPFLWNAFRESDLIGRYNIGVWYWELPELPVEWHSAFGLVDEIWAATKFILDSVSAKSPVPVVKIPPCISPVYDPRLDRMDYNLPSDRFLFMCAYDVLSTQARKNPIGAVEAFTRAFPKNDRSVGLVIKINNTSENPQEVRQLKAYVKDYTNCYILEDVFDKSKFNSLLNIVDAYISLHRSEGFGLIPAEAMSFGKPVIMTRWSGNLDFMTSGNSCGVDYKLIPVAEKSGPYTPGQFWADPDIDHASFFIHKLASDRQYYSEISRQAKKTIQDDFSPYRIGQLIKKRMMSIGLLS